MGLQKEQDLLAQREPRHAIDVHDEIVDGASEDSDDTPEEKPKRKRASRKKAPAKS